MKIALAILYAEPRRGGAEKYTCDLATALAEQGHEVSLLACRFAEGGDPVRHVLLDGAKGRGRVQRYRRYLDALDAHLAENAYDVVHAMMPVRRCDVYHPHAGIEADNLERGHLRFENPLRRILSRFGNRLNQKRRLFASVERQLLEEQRAKIICLSAAMQQVAWRHYAFQEGQVHVVPNGVDLQRYSSEGKESIRQDKRQRLGLSDTDVAALIVSNNHRRKGLRQAIEAFSDLAARDARAKLVVVGRDRTSRYERLATKLGVRERVIFAGPADDPVACYAACDLFVLPTVFDPCSLVVLEALAMGLPVITTRKNGAGEVMEDGVQGFLVDDQADVPALREAWGNLLSDSLRDKMRQAAMSLRGELSREKHLERVLAVYNAGKP